MSTFTNICPKVEYLTDRRFTYAHLAQLKHILPEVFEMKKILIHDEKTSCMKPDIHIKLNIDAINSGVEHNDGKQKLSGNLIMRKVFRARLLESFKAHPEGKVPEAVLPEPFNQSNKDVIQSNPLATPRKKIDSLKNEVCSSVGTPAKLVSTPLRLMSATPASQPPKRCYMSPDNSSTSSPCKSVKCAPRSRSLTFDSPEKNAKTEGEHNGVEGLSIDNDILAILPQSLLQLLKEREKKALEEQDPATIAAKRRQKMIAASPKLFDMICFLFQSINRSVITKEEFMHKLLSNHLGITERSETEEQLKLLQELVPGWIYEKLASSGDLLICINKMSLSSPELVRARLEEAK
ncbi:hypothetical protein NMG60_11007180 [Bertholletia excelsa]